MESESESDTTVECDVWFFEEQMRKNMGSLKNEIIELKEKVQTLEQKIENQSQSITKVGETIYDGFQSTKKSFKQVWDEMNNRHLKLKQKLKASEQKIENQDKNFERCFRLFNEMNSLKQKIKALL